MEETTYTKELRIMNIRPGQTGKGSRLFAELRDGNGQLLIGATLDYIVSELPRYYNLCE